MNAVKIRVELKNVGISIGLFVLAVLFVAAHPAPKPDPFRKLIAPPPMLPVVPADTSHLPVLRISTVLRGYTTDTARADRIAKAVHKEAIRQAVDPAVIIAVLRVETGNLSPRARSKVGARGLMQVMPFHAGNWNCGSRDLWNVEVNICHGVAILAHELKKGVSVERALLRYNGCVRGTNTPDCFKYGRVVIRLAEKAQEKMANTGS